MKKIILAALAAATLGLAAVTAAPTFAQTAPTQAKAGGHGGGRLKKLALALNLTDDQKAQMKPILKDARDQTKAIKSNTSLTPEAAKAQLKALHQSTMQQLRAILTPEQREKMKAMRQQHRARA